MRDGDHDVVEQNVLEKIRRERRRLLLDIARVEVERGVRAGQIRGQVFQHLLPQGGDVVQGNDVVQDDHAVVPQGAGGGLQMFRRDFARLHFGGRDVQGGNIGHGVSPCRLAVRRDFSHPNSSSFAQCSTQSTWNEPLRLATLRPRDSSIVPAPLLSLTRKLNLIGWPGVQALFDGGHLRPGDAALDEPRGGVARHHQFAARDRAVERRLGLARVEVLVRHSRRRPAARFPCRRRTGARPGSARTRSLCPCSW